MLILNVLWHMLHVRILHVKQLQKGTAHMAGDFVSGAQQTYQQKQQVASAVPTELNRQAAQRQNDPSDDGHSFVQDAQKWYTGANNAGTQNGWDTPFVESFLAGQQKAAEDGTLKDYFKNGGSGIATNDQYGTKFGDVYKDGVKVGNLYDAYDRDTANLMMADFTLDAETKAKAFKGGTLDDEIERYRDNENTRISRYEGVQESEKAVQARQKDLTRTAADEAIGIGGGAAGGALLGGAVGTMIAPVIGTAIGAGIGAVVGGIGGWLNRDEISAQVARTEVTAEMAGSDYNDAAEITTRIEGYGQLANQFISPLTNILHGTTDTLRGDGGDAEEGWYAVDPTTGQSLNPGILQVAEFGTRLGDAVLMGSSSIGMLTYQATMASQILGQVGTLTTTGGAKFNASMGRFDNIFETTAPDGTTHFDPRAAAAGIASIGIDAVQMAGFRGLNVRAISSGARATIAGTRGAEAQAAAKAAPVSDSYSLFDKMAANVKGSFAHGAKERGERIAYDGGRKFSVNEAGEATAQKMSLSVLAPSEMLTFTEVNWAARAAARAARCTQSR